MKFSAFAAGLLALALLAPARGWPEPVDDYVRAQMKKQNIPGLSLAVVKKGAVTKQEGYGFANVELNVPATAETIYQIQSVTKTFTATAIMMLVEEGKVKVEEKITSYLSGLPAVWNEITIRHLLTHTSGIKDFINEPTVDLRKDIKPDDVIKSLAELPLNFAPGEKYAYSNTGYHLLGMIIRKVTGQYWNEFLQERIFEPLGMTQTRVVSLADVITNRAAGYVWENDRLQNGHFLAPTILAYAGGGLRSTVLDLAKWDTALWGDKILKQAVLQRMWTAPKLNDGSNSTYGFGWALGEFKGHRMVSHTGSHMTGFKTVLMRFVDDHLTIIVLTNQRAADQTVIARGIAAYYLPGLETKAGGE